MIYRGVSQVLDYVLEMPTIHYEGAQVEMLHINADFPAVFGMVDGIVFRSSDHDPMWVYIIPYDRYVYFPQILQTQQD
jgi:predicted extracellular nuclease